MNMDFSYDSSKYTYTGYSSYFICIIHNTQLSISISTHCQINGHLEILSSIFLLTTHRTMISITLNAIRTKLINRIVSVFLMIFLDRLSINHAIIGSSFLKFFYYIFHKFIGKEFESKMINRSRHWMSLKKIWYLCYSYHLNFELQI